MGRPKEHDDTTRDALLAAAEQLVEQGGTGALSVRAVAEEIGASTRAVYSTFGSKQALLAALAQRSFEMLRNAIADLPSTTDPASDLIQAAVTVFRPVAVEHPSLFRIAFLRAAPDVELGPDVAEAASSGYELLAERVQRLADAGLLGGRDVREATREFNALCFGMAVTELLNPSLLQPDPNVPGAPPSTRSSVVFAHPLHDHRPRPPIGETGSSPR